MKATTADELGKALKDETQEIWIEGDMVNRVIRIRATGKVAWGIAAGAVACAVIATVATVGSGGTSSPATVPAAALASATAAGVLGAGAAATAISIAVAAGGVASLNKLRRNYRIEKRQGKTVLIRK